MSYYGALFSFLLTVVLLYAAWELYRYLRRRALRHRIETTPFPEEWRIYLEETPHYRALPDALKERIERKMRYFMETREFIGVKIEVTDEMRVVISFFACLMVLKIPYECFDALRTILIYPSEVIADDIRVNGGIYTKERLILEGQSAGDTVVIAWNEAKREAYHLRHHNVVVHELAHVLDFEEGSIDGIPPLERSRYHEWTRVLYRRFRLLQEKAQNNCDWGKYRLIGEYAATNEAEFFAVISELFFQKSLSLKKHFPDLYDELKIFYRLDTAELFDRLENSSAW